jgi:CRP/FNR family transcriptional regulator, cyclic AMP receptor protein
VLLPLYQGNNGVREVLKATQLFAELSDAELDSLSARAGSRHYPSGDLLFQEGQPCAGLFIVVKGRVRIFKLSPSGREQVLAVEGPGSSIAELPVFDGGLYPASASTMSESEIVFISRQDLRALCLEHPEISLKMLQVVGGRLRRLVGIIEELSFTTVRHRLISWIIRQAAGRPSFPLDMSHQELAAHIGTVRELVSRNLARLQAQGFIEIKGREVTISDLEGLENDLASAT